MRRSVWMRVLAAVLIISMLAAPVSAAARRPSPSYGTNCIVGGIISIIRDIIRDIWDDWFDVPGDEDPEPTPPEQPTDPSEPTEPGETEPEDPTEPEETLKTVLNLIEGHANTANGHLLRGVTYSLSQLAEEQSKPTPGSLRDIKAIAIGAARAAAPTTQLNAAASSVQPMAEGDTVEYGFRNWVDGGQYYIQSARAEYNNASSWLRAENDAVVGTDKDNATLFTLGFLDNGKYTLSYDDNGTTKYLYLNTSLSNKGAMDSFSTTAQELTIEHLQTGTVNHNGSVILEDDGHFIRIGSNGKYLCQYGGPAVTTYGAENSNGDSGNAMWFHQVQNGTTTKVTYGELEVDPSEPEQPAIGSELVYFPVTMFNYDMNTMNEKTISMYPEGSTLYNGIHFSDGKPGGNVTYAVTAHTGEYTNGQYVIQSYRQKDDGQPSWLSFSTEGEKGIFSVSDQADAAIWTLTRVPGANVFTLTTEVDGTTYYMTFGNETSGVTTEYSEVTLVYYTHTNVGIQLYKDGYYLGHSEDIRFCGNTNSTSTSNGMGFFPVAEDGTIGTTARTVTTINGAVTSGFSRWNWWSYLEDDNAAQNKFFAELVQHELDSNGDIVFNVPEPGIFKTGTGDNIAEKDVYTNVGLPFVLDETTGIYSFDSDRNGVYFPDKDGDGDSDPASGTETNLELLKFDLGAPQGWSGMHYGDGSSNLWAPFNTNTNDTGAGAIDYHFGMRADIPFSMTPNGRIKSTDDNSTPITFTFSGDDDVWVFIDGHLVIDLGGIHNRIGATIDFANNTITYFLPESNTNTSELGCYNDRTRYPVTVDENGKQTITVKLYNDAEGEGSLGQTRNDFASEEAHTMSIFYMERGKGTSNCHIEFNLPMRDTVLITKDASKSWSEAKDKEDEDGDGDGTDYLTAKEQAAVDKLNFGFTLYKKTADETEFTAVTNTNFYVQDKTGKVIATSSTDGNGKFYLKNGQTAKFMTDIPKEGITYYVVEDAVPAGFLTPDYKYAGAATWGYDYIGEAILKDENGDYILDAEGNLTSGTVRGTVTNAADMGEHELPMDATENKSYEVTVKGSVESIDSIEFICTNYLDAELPNPSALANEDIIVIDYGLPVQIDPLANDLFRGDNIEIVAWGDESLTLNEVKDESGNTIPHGTEDGTNWTGNKFFSNTTTEAQVFDSGNVTFTDVTYAEHAQEITNDDGTTTTTYTYTRDSFEYELTKQLTEVEEIRYIIKVTSTETQDGTGLDNTACRYALGKVYIVPATIMYYEENFDGLVSYATEAGSLVGEQRVEAYVSDYQEPGVVGTVGDSTYGSDEAYECDPYDSNGTSYKLDTTNGYVRFAYSFTGTGTSFFARTSAKTGYMQVMLFDGELTVDEAVAAARAAEQKDIWYRDTFYNDTNNTDLDGESLYNIPVFTNNELDYGTYTILVTVAKAGTQGAGPDLKSSGNEFYLDGIRVMQPLNESNNTVINEETGETITDKALSAYAADGESNLVVETLRQKLITDVEEGEAVWDGENFVVLTDTKGAITVAEDYISFGPKEEVYLAPGQKVTFSMKYWEPQGLKIYMGMKAPFGTVGTDDVGPYSAKLNVGKNPFTLRNATDCYYDVTDMQEKLEAVYIQAEDENGNLLFTDAEDNEIYMNQSGEFRYKNNNALYAGEVDELIPVDSEVIDYYVITYSFEATDSIVALTNIKVVGNFEFTIVEKNEETQDGPGSAEQ